MAHPLLILARQADAYRRLIAAANFPELECLDEAEAGRAEIVLGEPARIAPELERLPRLRWVQSIWAGVEPLIAPGLRRDYTLTNARDVFGPLMAEYVFGYLLAHERQMPARWRAQQDRRWEPGRPGRLQGKTLGLLGVGSIGAALAQAAAAFQLRVVGYTRRSQAGPGVAAFYHGDEWPAFAGQLDYLVGTLPATPATRHFLDAGRLSALPARAVFVNVGRGSTVDSAALADALSAGRLAAAVLDVTEPEPLPAAHVFWDTPNLTLTFHTAAPSFPEDLVGVFLENYARFRAGVPLRHTVDFAAGY